MGLVPVFSGRSRPSSLPTSCAGLDATTWRRVPLATVQGVGASLSGLAAGVVVDHLGYSPAFLTFGAAACLALAALTFAMPETAPRADVRASLA